MVTFRVTKVGIFPISGRENKISCRQGQVFFTRLRWKPIGGFTAFLLPTCNSEVSRLLAIHSPDSVFLSLPTGFSGTVTIRSDASIKHSTTSLLSDRPIQPRRMRTFIRDSPKQYPRIATATAINFANIGCHCCALVSADHSTRNRFPAG